MTLTLAPLPSKPHLEHLQKGVNNQQNMKRLAMLSCGELSVSDDFNSFLTDKDDFLKTSKQQQQGVFQKFCTAPFSQHQNSQTGPDEPIEVQERMLKNLSMQPSQTCIVCVPHAILKEMFIEANLLLRDESGIHQFRHNTSYYVQDQTRNGWAVNSS